MKPHKHASFCWRVADVALQKACELGQVVPADKVREIEAKARAEGLREGREDRRAAK